MGGRITVDSTPGEGAGFIVELPLPDAQAGQEPQQAEGPHAAAALDVLLVENATVAEVVRGLPSSQGHRVARPQWPGGADRSGDPLRHRVARPDPPGIDG